MSENTLVETPTWTPGIYQIETDDPVVGGPDGISNRQARELASRTAFLKRELESNTSALALHAASNDHPLATTLDKGMVILATPDETKSGVPNGKAVTPDGLVAALVGLATTEFVKTTVAALVDSSPAALDTLSELAAALGDDPNFAATITNLLATKAPLVSPNFTGKPTAPTAAEGTSNTEIANTAFVAKMVANLPVAALPYPTVVTADYRVGAVGAAVAGQGGTVSIPADVTIVMARNTSGSVGRQVAATTTAWTSGTLQVNSTYYLRAVINAAEALAPYVQRGTDADPIPAGLFGTPDAAAGGGFDTTQIDILLAKVVTGAAGTTPTVTNLANASHLMGHYEATGPATNYNPISIAYTFAAAFTLNWARAPLLASEFGWVFGADTTMHAGLMRYTRSISRYQVSLGYLCDWIGTPGQSTNVTCGATIDVAA